MRIRSWIFAAVMNALLFGTAISDIFAACAGPGDAAGPTTIVAGGTGRQYGVLVVVDPVSGNLLHIWQSEHRNDKVNMVEIYAQLFTAEGAVLAAPVLLASGSETHTPPLYRAPGIGGAVYNPIRREFLVLVIQYDGQPYNLFGYRISVAGQREGVIGYGINISWPFGILYNPATRDFMMWTGRERFLGLKLYRISSEYAPFAWSNLREGGDRFEVDPHTGRYITVWGNGAYRYRLVDSNLRLVTPRRLLVDLPDTNGYGPYVAYHEANRRFYVFWTDSKNRLHYRTVLPDGTRGSSDQSTELRTWLPAVVASNPAGGFMLLGHRAQMFRMDENLKVVSSFSAECRVPGRTYATQLVFNPASTEFIAAWTYFVDGPQSANVYARRIPAAMTGNH